MSQMKLSAWRGYSASSQARGSSRRPSICRWVMCALACAAICACGKSAKKQRPAMQTWVVQLSPGDVGAVPLHSYSVGGFSSMGQFAASGDGTKVVASQGLRHQGAVVIELATKPAAKLRNDAILATDQAPLLLIRSSICRGASYIHYWNGPRSVRHFSQSYSLSPTTRQPGTWSLQSLPSPFFPQEPWMLSTPWRQPG